MTDCGNAEIRDLLPDLAADVLSPVETTRVQRHVAGCVECAEELALLRTARAIRPHVGPIDIAKIVSRLPRPVTRVAESADGSVVSLDAHRALAQERRSASTQPLSRVSRSVWRMAAGIGVIMAGGWSVLMVRSGGLTSFANGRSDSVQLAAAVAGAGQPAESTTSPITAAAPTAASPNARGVAVSFGDLGNYTDDELQRVLDRLDKWDGATSTEAVTTPPILSVPRGGELE